MPDYAMNMTTSGIPLASLVDGGTAIFIIITIALSLLVMVMLQNDRIMQFLFNLKKKIRYTIIGTCTVGIGCALYRFVAACGRQVSEGDPVILKVLGSIIGGLVVVTVIGYFVDKYFIQKVKSSYKRIKKNK